MKRNLLIIVFLSFVALSSVSVDVCEKNLPVKITDLDGFDMIPLYRLRREIDGRCPKCKRKLAVRPLSISMSEVDQ